MEKRQSKLMIFDGINSAGVNQHNSINFGRVMLMPAKDQTFDLQWGPHSQKTKTVPDKSSQTIYHPSQLHSSLLHGKALIRCQGAIWQTGYHGKHAYCALSHLEENHLPASHFDDLCGHQPVPRAPMMMGVRERQNHAMDWEPKLSLAVSN